jgi:predicted transcriptional regulator
MGKNSKKSTRGKDFYLTILDEFKIDTSLTRIKNKYSISKQNLNYYIGKLMKLGLLEQRGEGWYEITEKGKNPTKYGEELGADSVRGHAYIWTIDIEKIPDNWNERIAILEKNGINYKLVGALKSTPRIMVQGRKVWLCNKHIRIFDKEKASYYGETAQESKVNGKLQAFRIIRTLENKLGIRLNPSRVNFVKEHYALVKNGLAKHHNAEGVILRISDVEGEWLLIDDSMGDGGELETVGKKAFETNPKVQDWWNDKKEHDFKITDKFVLERFSEIADRQDATQDQINEVLLMCKALVQEVHKLKNNR